jgi:opacity protein-like surface antigen
MRASRLPGSIELWRGSVGDSVVAGLQEATMQRIWLAGIAVGLLSWPALASDLPAKAPAYKAPIEAPSYDWSGFYLGVNFGGGWSNGSLNISGNNLYGGLTEFIGGVQAGYNLEAGASYLVSKVISIGLASVIQCFLLRHWVM